MANINKATAMELAERYNMEILRHPITREAWGIMCETNEPIPELDEYEANPPEYMAALSCGVVERVCFADDDIRYTIYCPTSWFDLWGWRD